MGRYFRGDVLLAPVIIRNGCERKVRPVVVAAVEEEAADLVVCPVSRRPPFDSGYVPIGLSDFAEGGLDIFEESYIILSETCRVKPSDVVTRKGRVSDTVMEQVPDGMMDRFCGTVRDDKSGQTPKMHGKQRRR